MKELPFSITRELSVPLVDQVAQGVRSGVLGGYYQPGDRLPSMEEMAEQLGVGQQTIRRAVQQLAREGEVVARPRQGIRIVDRHRGTFQRHVLHLRYGGTSYYFSTFNSQLEELLSDRLVRLTAVSINGREFAAGLPHVKAALASNHFDLAIVDGSSDGLLGEFAARDLPFVSLSDQDLSGFAAGSIRTLHRPPVEELAAHCRELGIRSAEVMTVTVGGSLLYEAAFTQAGIACRIVSATDGATDGFPGTVERLGFACMRSRLDDPTPLPDLLFVTDDYLARGALMALACSGLEIPGDLQLACRVNAGYEPCYPLELTRIVSDPRALAGQLAELIARLLDGATTDTAQTVSPVFIPGATTRPL